MNLRLLRFSSGENDTLGLLFVDGKFECYTLEDEYREEKVAGETRIPDGTYEIKFRTIGGMNERYAKRFPWHLGMLHLQDVKGFEWVYIHIGNKEDQTLACILVGDQQVSNIDEDGFVGASVSAYTRLYKKVSDVLVNNKKVFIKIETLRM